MSRLLSHFYSFHRCTCSLSVITGFFLSGAVPRSSNNISRVSFYSTFFLYTLGVTGLSPSVALVFQPVLPFIA